MDINTLFCISPVDGRYRKMTEKVADYFSEYAYIKYRVKVEIEWLKYILKSEICNISKEIVENVDKIYDTFDMISAMRVKEIEKITNHDVKAIEYYIKEEMDKINFSKYLHVDATAKIKKEVTQALKKNVLLTSRLLKAFPGVSSANKKFKDFLKLFQSTEKEFFLLKMAKKKNRD